MSHEPTDRRRFRILSCLGRGGFGEVYLAKMVSAGGVRADVALKVLHHDLDPRSQAVQRLRDEARLLGMLNHPSILRIIDLVLLENRVSLVTEYVAGADLDHCTHHETDPLPPTALLEVAAKVSEALYAAYTTLGPEGRPLHLLHRDVKPSNIRVGRHGEVKLLDFGIAKAAVDREAKTKTSTVLGSFPYMAPERFDAMAADGGPLSEVYSVGATLYEGLCGDRLFEDMPPRQHFALAMTPERHEQYVAKRLEALAGQPEAIRELVRASLAYDPADRPALETLGARLEDLADDIGGTRLSRWCRKHPWRAPVDERGELSGRTVTETELSRSEETYELAASVAMAADALGDTFPEPARDDGPTTREVDEAVALLADEPVEARRGGLFVALGVGAAGLLAIAGVALVLVGLAGAWAVGVFGGDAAEVPVAVDPIPDDLEGLPTEPEPGEPSDTDTPDDDPEDGRTGRDRRPRGAPVPRDPGAAPAPDPAPASPEDPARNQCGDPIALEPNAMLGRLPGDARVCLASAIRDGSLSQTDRGDLGRVLLVDARARCDNGGDCADYEREQRFFFEEIDRSDPEMLFAWATWLGSTAGADDARLAETRTWIGRAMEQKQSWRGPTYTQRVDTLHELDAKTASKRWLAAPDDDSLRIDARNAASDWMSFRAQLGRDTSTALALCAAAHGSEEGCRARSHEVGQQAAITFVSMPLGAKVFVDDTEIGSAPVVGELAFGTHTVRMELGEVTSTHEIRVGGDAPLRWTWASRDDGWEGGY